MTVVVIGNAVLDTTFEVDRLPHPGESMLARSIREDLGGKGLNQAVAAARAGATVLLRASIGDDAAGRLVHDQLLAEAMDTDFLLPTMGNTDRTTVFVLPDGENAIVTSAERSRSLTADEASEPIVGLGVGDVLLMQGNLSHGTTLACAELAKRQGLSVVLNPSPITFDYATLWPYVAVIVLMSMNAPPCRTIRTPAQVPRTCWRRVLARWWSRAAPTTSWSHRARRSGRSRCHLQASSTRPVLATPSAACSRPESRLAWISSRVAAGPSRVPRSP
jgi:sugar/nucleoside kinase (ribokinase family)